MQKHAERAAAFGRFNMIAKELFYHLPQDEALEFWNNLPKEAKADLLNRYVDEETRKLALMARDLRDLQLLIGEHLNR